jgi:hypothetical protein
MKRVKLSMSVIVGLLLVSLQGCTHADDYVEPIPEVATSSPNELLVTKFATAPVVDGNIDAVWANARPLINSFTVPSAGIRTQPMNPDGFLNTEPLDIFAPFVGESYKFSLKGAHDGTNLYLLLEVEDGADSKDRMAVYFEPKNKIWKQEHQYANNLNDKFYEDKFAFMFPIKDATGAIPAGWNEGTCTYTCHGGMTGTIAGDHDSRDTKHYMPIAGTKADLWHWKRLRGSLSNTIDDGFVSAYNDFNGTVDKRGTAAANGRIPDAGKKTYDDNGLFTDPVTGKNGPKWIIPGKTGYYYVTDADYANYTAKVVTGVAVDGTISYKDDAAGTIKTLDPNADLASYAQGTGSKRFPGVKLNDGTGYVGYDSRNDTKVKATHNGSKWIIEITRKLKTEDTANDVVFEIGKEMKFGMSFFNNSAIAHGTLNLLTMKIVE